MWLPNDNPWLLVNIPRERIRDLGVALGIFSLAIGVILIIMGMMAGTVLIVTPIVIYLLAYGLIHYLGLKDVDPMRSAHGTESLVGRIATAKTTIAPRGQVLINGELWEAISTQTVNAGQEVEIQGVEGLSLHVAPIPEGSMAPKGV